MGPPVHRDEAETEAHDATIIVMIGAATNAANRPRRPAAIQTENALTPPTDVTPPVRVVGASRMKLMDMGDVAMSEDAQSMGIDADRLQMPPRREVAPVL